MFPYDPTLVTAVRSTPQSVADVVQIMQAIETNCADGDGLKWFNWLYLEEMCIRDSPGASRGR